MLDLKVVLEILLICVNRKGKFMQGGVSDNAGGGKPHNNMPPYYALSYIMFIG